MAKVSNAQLQLQLTTIAESIADFKTTSEANKVELIDKIDSLANRIAVVETKIEQNAEANADLSRKVDENKASATNEIQILVTRIAALEAKVATLEVLPEKVKKLTEVCEERTNRQLRETLVFRNVPENGPEETYAQTKDLLANLISEHCNLSYDDVYQEIKRAHRESKRRDGENHYRQGKRLIFVALHSWDLCRTIIETFRLKCVRNADFNIAAEQKYGPLTTRRRSLALKKRKELKENGEITGGYVDFPARLMVNINGQVNTEGKKLYRLHTNFSNYELE